MWQGWGTFRVRVLGGKVRQGCGNPHLHPASHGIPCFSFILPFPSQFSMYLMSAYYLTGTARLVLIIIIVMVGFSSLVSQLSVIFSEQGLSFLAFYIQERTQ